MHEPLSTYARVEPELGQRVDGDLLEHAGSYPTFDICAAVPLEHHTVDMSCFQEMRKKHSGRSGADDCDLGSHELVHRAWQIRTSVQISLALAPSLAPHGSAQSDRRFVVSQSNCFEIARRAAMFSLSLLSSSCFVFPYAGFADGFTMTTPRDGST